MPRIAHARGARALLTLLLTLLLALATACESDKLNEIERQEVDRVLRTGVSFAEDPFVRAETLRILELVADPRLDALARERAEDPSPMVRVVALRALLATKNAEAERLALSTYTRADTDVRLAVLAAAEQYGPDSLRVELYQQALRSKDVRLRQIAFSKGLLAQVRKAKLEGDEMLLKAELIPELSKLVDAEDYDIAAAALGKLVQLDKGDRAQPLIERFDKEQIALEERVRLARILRIAQVKEARAPFVALADRGLTDQDPDPKSLKLPVKRIDDELLRAAVLSAVALGEDRYIDQAQRYLRSATDDATREVLEALALNTSSEATISLKIAMQDARQRVRHMAIELYTARADADAKSMISALRQEDPLARQLLATALITRFPSEWGAELGIQLRADETRLTALRLLRDVLSAGRDRSILEPLREQLAQISSSASSDEETAAIAAYLLLLSAPQDTAVIAMLEKQNNLQTRYVFLEQMALTRPRESVPLFRRFLYDDLYTLRLISAAGLWLAFRDEVGGAAPTQGAPAQSVTDPEEDPVAQRQD